MPPFAMRIPMHVDVDIRRDSGPALGIPIHVCLGGRVQRIKPQTVYRRLLAKLV